MARFPADPVERVLRRTTIPHAVKAAAWDAWHGADSTTDLERALRQLPLSQTLRADLWDLKSRSTQARQRAREPRRSPHAGGEMRTRSFPPVSAPEEDSRPHEGDTPATGAVSAFLDEHYRHFNAATLHDAAEAYVTHLTNGGQMFLAMAGAMSTAELGRCLAPMIRAKKIHAMCVTGANLEEDLFNLVAHDSYERFPDYKEFAPDEDEALADRKINRVTDTGIPEPAAMTPIEKAVKRRWVDAENTNTRLFPHDVLYDIVRTGELKSQYQADPEDSWLVAAAEADLLLVVPGWEDSTLGNVFAAECLDGTHDPQTMKSGIEYMVMLAQWYQDTSTLHDLGFFQIGGGIAGDFPICVVPLLEQDAKKRDTKKWTYFCQLTDADGSMGGYSGAEPTEKRSWGKLPADCPAFNVKGDATINFPLIAAKVMGW